MVVVIVVVIVAAVLVVAFLAQGGRLSIDRQAEAERQPVPAISEEREVEREASPRVGADRPTTDAEREVLRERREGEI